MKHCTKDPKCRGKHETLLYFLQLHFLVPQSLLVLCLSLFSLYVPLLLSY